MKFINILLLVIMVSCASVKPTRTEIDTSGNEVVTPVDSSSVDELPVVDIVDVSEDRELFEVSKFVNFKKSEIDKFYKIARLHDDTTKSACFRDFLVNRNMTKMNGKTALEVVNHLISEKPVIELEMYWSRKRVVGYTYANSKRIWMNRRVHNTMSDCSRSGNLGHERSHKLGYGHSYKNHSKRYLSVPYTINAGFKACCK